MCGIAGAIVLDGGFRITEPYLAAMRDRMVQRGPDGAGAWVSDDGRVGLAHRRLSIIDLSSVANQPMTNEDGRLQIVFNGEIYNHADIRCELQKLGGHVWRTDHSDTEVILHAFEQWGIAALDRFRGMFAIALWDERERELWLIRDRMGIKPLYYSVHHGRLTFASEIKALLADPQQERAVNERSLYHYLSFIAAPAPDTMFAGIHKLPNGCLLRIRANGEIEERRWYDLWDHVEPRTNDSPAALRERILDELRTAVRLRKVSDVPVGVFLSGGIDSSTNVALFSEGDGSGVKTFSIGYDAEYESYRNELHFAQAVAERFRTEHYEQRLTVDDLVGFLPEMTRLQDEPIADPVCVPLYFLSKLARDNGVVVCQAGEGADELFFGYANWYKKWRLQRQLAGVAPRLASRGAMAGLRLANAGRGKAYEALRRAARGQPIFWGTTEAFTEADKRVLLSPRLRTAFKELTSWEAIAPVWHRFEEKAWERSWMNWMTYVDLNTRLPELLLMRLDKMTMGVSLEGRVPFLDHKFAELVLGIPEARKNPGAELKHLLKGSVRGVIPDAVIDRQKQGFGVPVMEWLLGRLGGVVQETLAEFARDTDLFDARALGQMVERRDPRLWYVFNVALWWKTYVA